MKTLVNNRDKRIKITAPEIEFKPKYINGLCWDYDAYEIGREMTVYAKDWTLIEEQPSIVEIIKKFVEKGERCMQQAVEDQNPGNYTFWDGFHNCAENILREVEESTEGIRGKSKEIPAIKLKEIKSKLISAVKTQFYPGPEKEQIIQWIQNANL